MAAERAVEVDHRRPTLRGMSAGGGEEPSKMSSCARLAWLYAQPTLDKAQSTADDKVQ